MAQVSKLSLLNYSFFLSLYKAKSPFKGMSNPNTEINFVCKIIICVSRGQYMVTP